MNFLKTLKDRAKAWLLSKYSAGSVKASSLWANFIALLIGGGPDLVNFVLTYFDLITKGLLPTLSPENKANFLLLMNFLALVFRLYKQRSVTAASLKQAVEQGLVESPVDAVKQTTALFVDTVTQCGETKTPPGWYCTRDLGHEGPCAARELP